MSQPTAAPVAALEHALDEQYRDEPEHEARPGERRGQPASNQIGTRGVAADVDEVRDDVRRVRQEEEPRRGKRHEHGQPAAAAVAVVEHESEHERDPGEEEVPGQEAIVVGVRVPLAPGEQAETKPRGEARVPRASQAAGRRSSRFHRRDETRSRAVALTEPRQQARRVARGRGSRSRARRSARRLPSAFPSIALRLVRGVEAAPVDDPHDRRAAIAPRRDALDLEALDLAPARLPASSRGDTTSSP